MNETNALILINNIMSEYAEALDDLQYCATNRLSRTEARAKLDVCNTLISKMLNWEINECVRRDEKNSYISISVYDKNRKGEMRYNNRFSVKQGINFILNELKLKLIELR